MNKRWFFIILLVLMVFWAGKSNADSMAEAKLINGSGEIVGVATFSETKEGVQVVVHVTGLQPGLHGFHIHEKGSCETPDFKSAGGHFNPFGKAHGLKSQEGPHAGDMKNLMVGPHGVGADGFLNTLVTLEDGESSLFKPGGTALVVHKGTDDYRSSPSGNAGGRSVCGVVVDLKK